MLLLLGDHFVKRLLLQKFENERVGGKRDVTQASLQLSAGPENLPEACVLPLVFMRPSCMSQFTLVNHPTQGRADKGGKKANSVSWMALNLYMGHIDPFPFLFLLDLQLYSYYFLSTGSIDLFPEHVILLFT